MRNSKWLEILVPALSELRRLSVEGMENKAILLVCKTIHTSPCACYRGKIMQSEACTSSHGRAALYALVQTPLPQMNGSKMSSIDLDLPSPRTMKSRSLSGSRRALIRTQCWNSAQAPMDTSVSRSKADQLLRLVSTHLVNLRRRNHPSSTTLLFRCSRPSCLQSSPLKQTGHQKDGLKERPSLKPPLKELTRSSMHGRGSR